MNEVLEKLIEELRTRFYKVYKEKHNGYQAIIAVNKDGNGVIICIMEHGDHIYAKIVDLNKIMFWNCIHAIEVPYGTFVFADKPVRLLEKIMNKLAKSV